MYIRGYICANEGLNAGLRQRKRGAEAGMRRPAIETHIGVKLSFDLISAPTK